MASATQAVEPLWDASRPHRRSSPSAASTEAHAAFTACSQARIWATRAAFEGFRLKGLQRRSRRARAPAMDAPPTFSWRLALLLPIRLCLSRQAGSSSAAYLAAARPCEPCPWNTPAAQHRRHSRHIAGLTYLRAAS